MKIGMLGGTFDPVHLGHLRIAEHIRVQLDLAEVLFLPAGQPQLKESDVISPAAHRLQMLRLAIADNPHFKLSTIEIDRTGPSYSVDTVAELRGQLGAGDELFFILGWDSLAQLHRWREPARLVGMCHVVVVPRPGYPSPDLEALEGVIPGVSQRVVVMDKPLIDISATEIKDRAARGLSISHLVPEPVDEYIRQHKLYLSQ